MRDRSSTPNDGSRAFSQIQESNGLLGSGSAGPGEEQPSRLAALERLRAVTGADAALADADMQSAVSADAGVDPDVLTPRPQSIREQIYGKQQRDGAASSARSPLIEIVQRNRRSFVMCTLLGGLVGGGALAVFAPDTYRSESQLVLHPSTLRLADPEFAARPPTDSNLRILVSRQLRTIRSAPLLQTVLVDLNLQDDPEFAAVGKSGLDAIANAVGSLFAGSADEGQGDAASRALARAITVSRGNDPRVVNVEVVTTDPVKSATIANGVAEAYLSLQPKVPRAPGTAGTPKLDRQLDAFRLDAEAATERLKKFQADHGLLDGATGQGRAQRIESLETQLAQLRVEKAAIRDTAVAAARLDVDELLTGPLPPFVQDSPLVALQKRYLEASGNADRLTTTLAAGDPGRVAAEDTVDVARADFAGQVRAFIAMAQLDLRRQIEIEQQRASELAILRSRPEATPETLMQMRALEQAASAARQAYETFTQSLPVNGNRASSGVGTMIAATPALAPARPPFFGHALVGMGAGLAGGLALVLIAGALRSRRPNLAKLARPPAGPNAGAPDTDTILDPDKKAIEDAWADLGTENRSPMPEETGEAHADDAGPSDHAGQSGDAGPSGDYDQEAEAIRTEIRKMRLMVEQMQQADHRTAEGDEPPCNS